MPRKVRELVRDLIAAGFYEIPGGKGSGDDAKPYQERQVRRAIEEVEE